MAVPIIVVCCTETTIHLFCGGDDNVIIMIFLGDQLRAQSVGPKIVYNNENILKRKEEVGRRSSPEVAVKALEKAVSEFNWAGIIIYYTLTKYFVIMILKRIRI